MKNNWTREEHIVAFNLYCKIPFSKINSGNKEVQALAAAIGRSTGAVAMKLANFARLDPALTARNISGLTQGAKGEKEVWDEFNSDWEKLAFESETILANFKRTPLELSSEDYKIDLTLQGIDRESIVKIRINQDFFRKSVLASYNNKCCITGMNIPELLVAGHIIPWADSLDHRTNPANGLCMNCLFDKAFDKGLMTITPEYEINFSKVITNSKSRNQYEKYFQPFQNQRIILPQRFYPAKEFLRYHNENIFIH